MKKFSFFRVCLLVLLATGFTSMVMADSTSISSYKKIEMQPVTREGRTPAVTGLSISDDGKTLVTVGDDHKVRVWDVNSGTLLHSMDDQRDWGRSVKFSPDGKSFVVGCMDENLYCYDAQTFRRTVSFESPGTSVRAVVFDPHDRARLAVVGYDNAVFIYDTLMGRKMYTLKTTCNDQRSVQISADSRFIAAAGRDGNVRVFDMVTTRTVVDLNHHRQRVWAIAFSDDGQFLATGGDDRKVLIWSMKDFQLKYEFEFPSGKVSSLTFCGPSMIAAGATNDNICVWNLNSTDTQPTYRLNEHKGTVAELLWDDANQTLISCSFDSTVRFWKWSNPGVASAGTPSTH